jgi:hypothetical protein
MEISSRIPGIGKAAVLFPGTQLKKGKEYQSRALALLEKYEKDMPEDIADAHGQDYKILKLKEQRLSNADWSPLESRKFKQSARSLFIAVKKTSDDVRESKLRCLNQGITAAGSNAVLPHREPPQYFNVDHSTSPPPYCTAQSGEGTRSAINSTVGRTYFPGVSQVDLPSVWEDQRAGLRAV